MKTLIIFLMMLLPLYVGAQALKVGDSAPDFKLKNVDGKMVSLSDYKNVKGFVVIFTCNHCPYAKAYEDRIIDIDKSYKSKGFPVIAINSNDATIVPEDSYEGMIKRAKEKNFTFPYLHDETQEIVKKYGAERTPHVYLLKKDGKNYTVAYIGAIDDNYKSADEVKVKYLENAIKALLDGKKPEVEFTKAIGCTIKMKPQGN